MEIHVPKAPHSWREFARELVTITAGILIALSLEGLTEWNHHRHLVREARENIVNELRGNDQELEKSQASLKDSMAELQKLSDVLRAVEHHQKLDIHELGIHYVLAELHRTSWNTAANTGAIGYMPYPEVQRYTEVYDLQAQYERVQQDMISGNSGVLELSTLPFGALDQMTPDDVQRARRAIRGAIANIGALRDIGRPLDERYRKVLEEK